MKFLFRYSISSICYTICIVVLIWNLVLTKFYKLNNECIDLDDLRNNTKEKRAVEDIREYWLFVTFLRIKNLFETKPILNFFIRPKLIYVSF